LRRFPISKHEGGGQIHVLDAENPVHIVHLLPGNVLIGRILSRTGLLADSLGIAHAQYTCIHSGNSPLDIVEARDCRWDCLHPGRTFVHCNAGDTGVQGFISVVYDILVCHDCRTCVSNRSLVSGQLVQEEEKKIGQNLGQLMG
jgi:hypothetical protein